MIYSKLYKRSSH
jgi:hypothetical protein